MSENDRDSQIVSVKEGIVFLIGSSRFGQGNPRLGESLMKDFLTSLKTQSDKVAALLLYNSGVVLASASSELHQELQELEKLGIQILVSAASLNFYNLNKELKAGTIISTEEMTGLMVDATQTITLG